MTTTNEPLTGIQARIEELQNTITEKEEQIKARARKLKDELKEEISPIKFIRKHPFEVAGTTFLAGMLLIKALRGQKSSPARIEHTPLNTPHFLPSQSKNTLSTIGLEILRSVKDLGFTYLQRYLDKKIK